MPIITILFLTLVNLLNYFDRYIVQAVEPTITKEFGLTNTQAGYLVSSFVLGYFIFSPLFGYLGDKFDRRKVMAAGLLAWSAATALTSYASGILTFVVARILVGVGEACYAALVPVYLKNRLSDAVSLNRALSVFYVAIPVGSALGYVAGGQVAALYGWRSLFTMAAIPGVALALGFLFLRADGLEASTGHSRPDFRTGLGRILASRILVMLIMGYVANTFALNGIAAFVVRHGTSLGMTEAEASTYFGVILVATGLLGTLGGGMLTSYLARKSENALRVLLSFIVYSTLLAVPFLGLCFLAQTQSLFLLGCAAAELFVFAGVAPLNSLLVAKAPAGLEALTQGVAIFAIQLFGGFLGPVIIGGLADLSGSLAIALQGTTAALAVSALLWWICISLEGKPKRDVPA